MRWVLDQLKGLAAGLTDMSAVDPRAARGCYVCLLGVAAIAAGLMAINPAKFAWAPTALIGIGIFAFILLIIGFLAMAGQIAGGSGLMGGRTGVMLKDLEVPAEESARKKPTVKRKGDTVPEWKLRPKVVAADAVLAFLAEAVPAFAPAKLARWVEETVVAVRDAVGAEDLGPVAGRLTPGFRKTSQAELDDRANRGERRAFGKVTVMSTRPIVVDAGDPDRARVTALVTIKSQDYVLDARKRVIDGSKDELVVVQEFWTVRRDGAKWKVESVRPSEDADEVCDLKSRLARAAYDRFRRTADRNVLAEVHSA